MTAATMLGKFGSQAAESPLWQRYATWSAQWAGRESELDITVAEAVNEKLYQRGLGLNLMQALATGRAWLSDKTKLQRLSQMTKARQIQQQLDGYLKIWEDQPTAIFLEEGSSSVAFYARVAQYEFHSIDVLKDKLTQFPSGTKFVLSVSTTKSSVNDQTVTELRTFLSSHGMSLVGERRAY
jgi:hypothetical protein